MKIVTLLLLLALCAPAYSQTDSQTIDWKSGGTSFHAQPSPLYSPDPASIFHGTPTIVRACLADQDQKITLVAVTTFYRVGPDTPEQAEAIVIGLSYRYAGVSCFSTLSRVPSATAITMVLIAPAPVALTKADGGSQ